MNFDEFQPTFEPNLTIFAESSESVARPDHSDLPTNLNDYPYESSNAYDLSIEAAAKAGLPVFDVSGGYSRRVITLERTKYLIKKIPHPSGGDIISKYGHAVRLCITVNKFDINASLKLPVLAASAQLGHIEARWGLNISGLSGTEISSAILPPKSLDVETFVLASQSLEKMINAVHHESTHFTPVLLSERLPENAFAQTVSQSIGRIFALDTIKDGRSYEKMQRTIDSYPEEIANLARETYKRLVGDLSLGSSPTKQQRQRARELLHGINVQASSKW